MNYQSPLQPLESCRLQRRHYLTWSGHRDSPPLVLILDDSDPTIRYEVRHDHQLPVIIQPWSWIFRNCVVLYSIRRSSDCLRFLFHPLVGHHAACFPLGVACKLAKAARASRGARAHGDIPQNSSLFETGDTRSWSDVRLSQRCISHTESFYEQGWYEPWDPIISQPLDPDEDDFYIDKGGMRVRSSTEGAVVCVRGPCPHIVALWLAGDGRLPRAPRASRV